MYIPFEELNNDARIWIYQSDRMLNASEVNEIEVAGKYFVSEWTAHQQTLHSSFRVLHSLFLIVAVDENVNDASGCSIDKSVHFIRQMEQRFNLNLFNRLNVGFISDAVVDVKPVKEFVDFYNNHASKNSLKIFNNLISSKKEIGNGWISDVKDSWLAPRISKPAKA